VEVSLGNTAETILYCLKECVGVQVNNLHTVLVF